MFSKLLKKSVDQYFQHQLADEFQKASENSEKDRKTIEHSVDITSQSQQFLF